MITAMENIKQVRNIMCPRRGLVECYMERGDKVSHVDVWGESTPGREDRKCKGSQKGSAPRIQKKTARRPLRLDLGE